MGEVSPVSVTEIAPRGEEFERTPPHDLAAEQCVLGGMLMSKDAISDVLEVIRPSDHYRPAHQLVHEVILDLYSRGEPADAVTVANELTKRGEIARVGGAPYLHTLMACVPTAANAGYYARIVRERAILRRLVEAGTRIVQLGYSGDGEADELVDRAEAEVYGVTDRRVSEDYLPLAEIMPGALDEIEAIGGRGGALTGVPTGFADLDALTNGLHPGQMIVIAARPALGKALALDTPLPTPAGWTTMGEVAVGDQLIGAAGKPVTVVAATEAMHDRPCYEVEFSTGEVIVADGQHQWLTWPDAASPRVVRTEQIAAALQHRPGRQRQCHAVPMCQPLDLPEAQLAIPPYALGAWLGNSTTAGAHSIIDEPEIAMRAGAENPAAIPELSHLPVPYLRASEQQRRALLAGLLDVAGTVLSGGAISLAVTSPRLAQDVRELIVSLGYRCSAPVSAASGSGDATSACYELRFTAADQVFLLSRKQRLHKERLPHNPERARWHHIVNVRRVPSRPVRCVQVNSSDRLYLAGSGMIPTHNSTLALDLARAASVKTGLTSVIFSLEMSRNEITMRLLSAEARVPLHSMRTGQLGEEDWTRLARRMSEVVDAPLFIDDSPNMSMMEIRAKCRRLKQRHDLRLVIIDYLQLMSSPKRVENRQQEVSEMSRSLKLLAKELDVPVVAVAQLNRGPEQRTDKRPLLADLRESGCLTQGTRILRADTGSEITLGELIESGARNVPVWSLDERLRLVPRMMTHAFPSGIKEVFRVRLRSGREVEATAHHPFLTYDGWRPLAELKAGSRVAVPRSVPGPTNAREMPEAEIILLAHLIGDGSFVRNQPIRYASKDEGNLAAVATAAKHLGVSAVRDDYEAARCTSLRLSAPYRLTHGKRNPIAEWLDELGLFGLRSHEKFIPSEVFSLPRGSLRLFLRQLWSTDGSVTVAKSGAVRVYYATTSERLARDLQILLLRFGISARLRAVGDTYGHPQWTVDMPGVKDQRQFLTEIGVRGARQSAVEQAQRRLDPMTAAGRFDTVPAAVWSRVSSLMNERSLPLSKVQASIRTGSRGDLNPGISPARTRLGRIAAVLGDAELEMFATNDVFWDTIASIQTSGPQPVYDATVLGTHNFIANAMNLHNSIEQDSDVVILLHREDAYERESPRAGEADFIVAKHRNGPTATVTVAFQGHYSRFVDMARI
jgi:replicative DNA helicase